MNLLLLLTKTTLFVVSLTWRPTSSQMMQTQTQGQCLCGIPNNGAGDDGRMTVDIKSDTTKPYYFSWTVYIRQLKPGGKPPGTCSGSLIHPYFVLTAAHCVQPDMNASQLLVSMQQECGIKDLPDVQLIPVVQAIRHPKYGDCTGKGPCSELGGDIALLRLARPQLRTLPVCLGVSGSYNELLLNGWGKLSDEKNKKSKCLHVSHYQTVEDDKCKKAYSKSPIDHVQCAGSKDTGAICGGDSGSGLLTMKAGRYYQVGIASFADGDCDSLKKPSVFERISTHVAWIRQVTQGAVCFNNDFQTVALHPANTQGANFQQQQQEMTKKPLMLQQQKQKGGESRRRRRRR